MSSSVRKRSDVSERKKHNRTIQTSVIKTTLNTFIKEKIIIRPLEYILLQSNKIVLEAYNLANYHILHMIDNGYFIDPNQDFFYKCLSAVGNSSSKIKDALFNNSVQLYKQLRPIDYIIPDSSYISTGILQNFSLQMATNTTNFFELHFYSFFKKYIKHKYNLDNGESYKILYNIISESYDGNCTIVLIYRKMIDDIVEKTKITKNIKNPYIITYMLHHILKYNESIHEKCKNENRKTDKNVRLFSILPNKKGFTYSHVKICKNGLYSILKHIDLYYKKHDMKLKNEFNKMITDTLLIDFNKLQTINIKGHEEKIWNLLFNIKKFEKKNKCIFKNEIMTDGKAVSITFEKPLNKLEYKNHEVKTKKQIKKDNSKKNIDEIHNLNIKDYDNILGLDPGRTSIFVATDTNGRTVEYKSKKYYDRAKFRENGRKIKTWTHRNDEIKEIIKIIPTNRSSSIDLLEKYNRSILENVDKLFNFYGSVRIRNCKMKNYIYSQKELRSMCSSISGGKEYNNKVLVGFGNWSATDNGGIIKKVQAGPVMKLKKMLKQYCKVVDVDEYKTSKVHNVCKGCTLKHHYMTVKKDDEIHRKKIHSVLFCTNKSCNGITMNRDMNASKNILDILLNEIVKKERPESFNRIKIIDLVTNNLEN